MRFNAETFESLSGLDLATYAVELMRERIPEGDFLPYFRQKAEAMDMVHLELAVGMLGKVGSAAALQTVASYLEHPDFNVRFVATKTIACLHTADEVVMRCAVESLSKHEGDRAALANELMPVLDRPANEQARRLASAYRLKSGAQ
jgi:hypothetical protein